MENKESGNSEETAEALAATGIAGLDHVLEGGLTAEQLYLIEGNPGSGKTTLALHFLMEGVARGENGLLITLSETRRELLNVARAHGWSMEGIEIFELTPSEESLRTDATYTIFHPSEVELSATTKAILEQIERVKPRRVVFDSLSELRLLAQNALRYRRQVLSLKRFFIQHPATVLLLDDLTSEPTDLHLQSIVHGVIRMDQQTPDMGAERRRMRVLKLRGRHYRGGYHDYTIVRGGLRVFPRMVAAEHHEEFRHEQLSSGVAQLDALLGGGVDRGTSTLIMGPAGSGKSTVTLQYVHQAATRGEKVAIFTFDEVLGTMLARAAGIGIDLLPHIREGRIAIQQVDPAELTPGEFACRVQQVVAGGARVVVIDSINGYLNSMPEERLLLIQFHELLTYLAQQGVVTLLVLTQHGIVGGGVQAPVDISYLADTVLLLRYFEAAGEVRLAISALKRRAGEHERTIRELRISNQGLHVGEPLRQFQGVLTGEPVLGDGFEKLLGKQHDPDTDRA